MTRAPTITLEELERLGIVVDPVTGVARKRTGGTPGPTPRTPRVPSLAVRSEHLEQAGFVGRVTAMVGRYPHWELLYAIPNFSGRLGNTPTVALIKQARRHNAEGRKKGVRDLCLPVTHGPYHGLYLELKRRVGGKIEAVQRRFVARLRGQGYAVAVCRGEDAAWCVLRRYEALGAFEQHAPAWDISDLQDVR